MTSIVASDEKTGRKFYLDAPDEPGSGLTLILNLHGGGSVGAWQRAYFPAKDFTDAYQLVVATPSCATKEPFRHWVGEADDAHLRNIVTQLLDHYGRANIKSFWLAGHSQGGMTSNRLLNDDGFFIDHVDGWLSLSGGRIGAAERAPGFSLPMPPGVASTLPRFPTAPTPTCDFSFIYTTGEHEIATLPDTSPWAEKYGAGPRVRAPDIVDTEAGQIYDTTREAYSTPGWGLKPGPGTAHMWTYPNARDGRVIADVVRVNKGHTEGLEPHVTEALVKLMVSASGGKVKA